MSIISRTSNFLLDKVAGTDEARVRYRVRYEGNNIIAFNCKIRVEVDKWSMDTQRCIRNSTHTKKKIQAKEINKMLDEIEEKVDNVFKSYEEKNTLPSVDEARLAINIALGRKEELANSTPLTKLICEYVQSCRTERAWTDNTANSFKTVITSLTTFSPKLSVADINVEFYKEWMGWLMDNKKSDGTISIYSAIFKTFVQWLVDNKYILDPHIEECKYRLKSIDKPVVFLEFDEVRKFMTTDFGKDNIIRDAYCLSAFTSLRISDIMELTPSHITNDEIIITLKKTSKPLVIPLNKYSKEIINRITKGKKSNKRLFEGIKYPATISFYLHKMMKKCGFDEPVRYTKYLGNKRVDTCVPRYELLTFHTARKSFVCMMLSWGIAPNVVMKFTGHRSYNSMMPYIDITKDAQKNAMSIFDTL